MSATSTAPPTIQTAPEIAPDNELTLTLAVPSSTLSRYQQLVALFAQTHPAIVVNVVGYDSASQPRDRASQADVFFTYPTFEPHDNALLDLQPLIENDPTFNRDDFWSGSLPEPGAAVWALPTAVSYQLIYYDKTAFDAANLPYPPLDWTVADFLSAARTLTEREDGEVTRWGYVSNQVRREPLLAAQLTKPFVEGEVERLTDPDVAEAITWLAALFTADAVAPWLDTYKPLDQQPAGTQSEQFNYMNNGKAAMWQRSHPLYATDAYDHTTVGATTIPTAGNGLAAEPIIEGFAISQGTQHRDAAWQLLTFLTSQPPVAQMGISPLPACRAVAEASGYWGTLPDEVVEAVRYSAENSLPPRFWPDNQLIPQAVAAVVAGETAAPLLNQPPEPPAAAETAAPIVVATAPVETVSTDAEPITFAVHPWDYDRLLRLANSFNQSQSDILVTLRQYGEGEEWQTGGILADIEGADCLAASTERILTAENHHVLLPVDSLFELDSDLDQSDFFPVALAMMRYDETLYGVPAWTEFMLLQYNRQLFIDKQVPEPPLNWTMDEFLSTALALTADQKQDEEKIYAYVSKFPFMQFYFGLRQFQPQLLDTRSEIPTADFSAAAPYFNGMQISSIAMKFSP
ncbi:MAG: extracellular solute-binding protein [Chloroflexi bacterium]|nr:extracellular solute-binding protein [Chloroflexota bacterium]